MNETVMNKTVESFLESLNIDINKFKALEGATVKRGADVNPILSRFAMFKAEKNYKLISIDDVLGYDYRCMDLGSDMISNLSRFFDGDGDNYHRRSVSMLEIPQSELMDKLYPSFSKEPIYVAEVDKGKYNISNNGMHRFHVLKIHFLDELSKLNPKDKNAIKNLTKKYSFVANVTELDYVKTYSAFLLKTLDKNLSLENHYDSNYGLTDKSRLINYLNDDEKILTDDQLIELVNKKLDKFMETAPRKDRKQFKEMINDAFKFESFKNYYNVTLKQNQKEEREWN